MKRSTRHPRQCHLCRYNGVNALLAERGLAPCAEAERACLACVAVDLPNDGISWVHANASKRPDAIFSGHLAPDYGPTAREGYSTTEDEEKFLTIFRHFGGLPFASAGVVCGMLAGKTLSDMSTETGLSVQNLHARWKRACAADPIWRSIETGMMGKGVGRKAAARVTLDEEAANVTEQMELGI